MCIKFEHLYWKKFYLKKIMRKSFRSFTDIIFLYFIRSIGQQKSPLFSIRTNQYPNTTIYRNLQSISRIVRFTQTNTSQKLCFDEIQSVSNSPVQTGTPTNKEHISFPEFQSILKKKRCLPPLKNE